MDSRKRKHSKPVYQERNERLAPGPRELDAAKTFFAINNLQGMIDLLNSLGATTVQETVTLLRAAETLEPLLQLKLFTLALAAAKTTGRLTQALAQIFADVPEISQRISNGDNHEVNHTLVSLLGHSLMYSAAMAPEEQRSETLTQVMASYSAGTEGLEHLWQIDQSLARVGTDRYNILCETAARVQAPSQEQTLFFQSFLFANSLLRIPDEDIEDSVQEDDPKPKRKGRKVVDGQNIVALPRRAPGQEGSQ